MKKFYFSLLLFSVAVASAFGQARISGTVNPVSVEAATFIKGSNPSSMSMDTLWPPVVNLPCFTGAVYYNWAPPAVGFVSGNCSLPQAPPNPTAVGTEVAQRCTFSGTGTISEVLVYYGYKSTTGPGTGTTTVKLYTVNTLKKPGTTLSISAAVTVANVDDQGGFTSYTFGTPVSVTTNFFASVVFPTNGDTVVVWSSTLTCNSVDSLGAIRFASPYGWNLYSALFNRNNVRDTMIDIMIFPIVDNVTGTNEHPSSGSLTLLGAYPNPAASFTNIRYEISESSIVAIKVFDLTGRVFEKYSENLQAGKHEMKVSLKNIPAGNYYYTIKTDRGTLTSKFVVAK